MNSSRAGISALTAAAGLIVVVVIMGAALLYSLSSTGVSTSTTPVTTTASNFGSCTTSVTISGITPGEYCAVSIDYATFQQFVNESSLVQDQNGTIFLTIGYRPCINYFDVLPNGTQVEIHRGTANATQICE
jgi:hypothetical protein